LQPWRTSAEEQTFTKTQDIRNIRFVSDNGNSGALGVVVILSRLWHIIYHERIVRASQLQKTQQKIKIQKTYKTS
jgi:hypothetical protein